MFFALPSFEVLDLGICVLCVIISYTVLSTWPPMWQEFNTYLSDRL